MKKSVLFTALIAAASAFNASAESFTVGVDVNKVLTPLSITQNAAMVIPTIQVDESLDNGDVLCSSYYDVHPGKDYCTGTGSNGMFTVNGTPHALVSIVVDNTGNNVVGGLQLNLYAQTNNSQSELKTLDASGASPLQVRGDIVLQDYASVSTANLVFNYNVTATYQ